jgi:hypothetical protein
MGRPLAKRFFGEENTDDTGETQANYTRGTGVGIGGQGVASYGTIVAGSGWTTIPTVTFHAPSLPGGVAVTAVAHYQALSFATTANGTGYNVGDVLQVDTGTQTTKARAPVASIVTLGTPTITNGGYNYDVSGSSGDHVTYTHANLSTPLIVKATAVSGSTITTITVLQQGVWTGTGAFPTSMAGGVGGFTATTSGGPIDNNGNGLVLSFSSSNWGVYAFGTVSTAGNYTAFPSSSGSLTSISPATGTGATATITMGLLSVVVSNPGAGFISVADAAVTFSGSTGASATAVLTTDDGTPYDPEAFPAIIAYAKTTSGGSNKIADINRQRGAQRYYVTTADGTAVCQLKTSGAASVAGEMTITATDSSGGTYYVAKLTAHKAVLVPNTGSTFAANTSVHWTFSTSDSTYNSATTVVIQNA